MKEIIINKNNWFIAEIIEMYEPLNSDTSKELRRITTYGNYHLIKAETPSQAFDKAVKIGKQSNYEFINSNNIKMKSEFVGIGDLVPITENIEDGAEILWNDYGQITARRTLKMNRSKKELLDNLKKK